MATDDDDEMAMVDVFLVEDERPGGGEGGEEEGPQPLPPPLSPVMSLPQDREARDDDGSWRTTMRAVGAEGAAAAAAEVAVRVAVGTAVLAAVGG